MSLWRKAKTLAGWMNRGSTGRHSRREFIQKIDSVSLVACLNKATGENEIIDFSATPFCAKVQEALPLSPPPPQKRFPQRHSCTLQQETKRRAAVVHTDLLPGGKRQETFDNGSILSKDELGRVIEVYSGTGECLFLSYDQSGELSSFTRMDSQGNLHSTAKKGRQSVTVRDAEGRAKALGEFMTVDHFGRFFLHTRDGQYFSLDLITNIHCERRRLVKAEGKVSYVTAAFAHDGFRMATAYARNVRSASRHREITYRFYGRDGSIIEFGTEEEFRDLKPTQSLPPCTMPVHRTWQQLRQAHTAWESVNEYLRSCGETKRLDVNETGARKARKVTQAIAKCLNKN